MDNIFGKCFVFHALVDIAEQLVLKESWVGDHRLLICENRKSISLPISSTRSLYLIDSISVPSKSFGSSYGSETRIEAPATTGQCSSACVQVMMATKSLAGFAGWSYF